MEMAFEREAAEGALAESPAMVQTVKWLLGAMPGVLHIGGRDTQVYYI